MVDELRLGLVSDRVYVFTPDGHVVDLEAGATPVDFAYHIHTEVGHRCRGAKINGHIVPLNYTLNTGEQVTILTAKEGGPSRDWLTPSLGYVATSSARARIHQWFKRQDRDVHITQGKAMLEKEMSRLALDKVDLFDHLDLLVKHRISMVRCDSTTGGAETQCLKPRSLRFGVWQAPPARRLTGRLNIGWWTTMNIRRVIHRCSRRGGIVHLLLQADELLNRGMLETILRCVANRRQNDSLGCLTLQQLSRQVQMQPPRVTSQSLLNRAA